jgi:flagellar motor protein MotB
MRFKKKKSIPVDDYQGLISDLMASLTFIFIIAMMAFMKQHTDYVVTVQNYNEAREELLIKLKESLKDYKVNVIIDENFESLRITDTQKNKFFESADEMPTKEGKLVLEVVAKILNEELNCETTNIKGLCDKNKNLVIENMLLEGHTDSEPISGCLKKNSNICDNLSLSKNRAYYAYNIIENVIGKEKIQSFRNLKRQSIVNISGYGATRLIKDIPQSSALNRRIDIRFLMHQPDIVKNLKKKITRKISSAK